jgi:tetratricopeptide (TPR) repeat protein
MQLIGNVALPCDPWLHGSQLLNYPRDLEIMRLIGSESSIYRISVVPVRTWTGLVLVLCVGAASLGASLSAAAETCSSPRELEARLHSAPTSDAYELSGNWFLENKEANCAVEAFQSALKIDPASKKALDGLAKGLIAAGDYGTVIRRLRSVPLDENLTLDLAIAYRMADMFDEAQKVLTEGLKTYPNSDGLTGALVSLDIHVAHSEAAQALAEKQARQKPRDIEAQRIYLRTLIINGDNQVAAPLGRKLLALAPHDPDFLYLNGILERGAGDFAAARKHLEESVALNPNFYNSHFNLGVVLEQLQDAAGAREQFKKAIELGANEPEVRFELAKVLRTLGETEEAQEQLKLYQQRLKEESDKSLAILKSTQAEEAVKAGDNRKAADLFREASAALPGNPALANRLAVVLGELGDTAGERTALQQAIEADPEFAPAQYQLGYLETREGDNAAAEQQFRLALKAAPNYIQAWVALAATLGMESRFQEAQDAVANALKIEPDNKAALELSQKLADAQGQH